MTTVIPQRPKKALSPFFLYRAEVYDGTKEANPDARITVLTKIIADMWNKESEGTKRRLKQLYEKNKVIADENIRLWQEQYGENGQNNARNKKSSKISSKASSNHILSKINSKISNKINGKIVSKAGSKISKSTNYQ